MHMTAHDAVQRLSERAGRTITLDDLRQMRRHGHIEGEHQSDRIVVYTPEQVEAATIPVARKSPENRKPVKKKRRKTTKKPV